MYKFALSSTVAVVLLARLATTLIFLHFMYSFSPKHAAALAMAYLIMMIGERNLWSLSKSGEGEEK